jgi:hypothetical protein
MANTAPKPVYLRGLPSEVVREAKAAAARRGVTLGGFIAEALSKAMRERESSSSALANDLSGELRWYEKNRERLVKEYGGQYVAIVGGRVIDHDASFEALAERVFAREGARNIFMPRVSSSKEPLRVRSPRLRPA